MTRDQELGILVYHTVCNVVTETAKHYIDFFPITLESRIWELSGPIHNC